MEEKKDTHDTYTSLVGKGFVHYDEEEGKALSPAVPRVSQEKGVTGLSQTLPHTAVRLP